VGLYCLGAVNPTMAFGNRDARMAACKLGLGYPAVAG